MGQRRHNDLQTVLPVLLYGAEIWNVLSDNKLKKDKDDDIESLQDLPQEKIHMSYCKFVLGVNKRATHDGVLGELGRFPLYINAIDRSIRFFARVKSAENDSLLNVAYRESMMLHNNGSITWFSNIVRVFKRTNSLNYLIRVNAENVNSFCKEITSQLKDRFSNSWKRSITQVKRNGVNPKLRTYATFKNDISRESYLKNIKDFDLRAALAKFRISAHNLHIETGRYTTPKLLPHQRTCRICQSDKIDDEFHCVMECIGSIEDRNTLFNKLGQIEDECDKQKFIRIMKSSDLNVNYKLS